MTYAQPTPAEIARRRADLAPFDGWNERMFCQIAAWAGLPRSYLDLGSGTGAMVNIARRMGIEAWGVDVINGPEHWFLHHDLTQPFDAARVPGAPTTVALITCLEVAEHLPEEAAPVLVQTIARHLEVGGILLFSAAPPGQHGEHHVNLKPAHWWRSLFYEHGISYREDLTRQIAHLLGWVAGPASAWVAANIQVFDR